MTDLAEPTTQTVVPAAEPTPARTPEAPLGDIESAPVADLPVTVYTPESPLRHPGRMVGQMIHDLVASRELAWRLFLRDISAMYRQSILGYLWAFLPPVVTTITFVFLNAHGVVKIPATSVPYPVFVMIGTVIWQTFIDALGSPLRVVQNARSMLTKINFPREALILSGLAEVIFNFLIRVVLLVPLLIYYQVPIDATVLLAPLGVASAILLGLTFGMLLVPAGLLYGDVGRAVTLLSGFWMLLTPVVYPVPTGGLGVLLAKWNPVSPLVLTTRQWLTAQPVTHFGGFLVVSLAAVLVLLFGWVLYRLSMPILIERMGS